MGSVVRERRKKARILVVDDHPLIRERLREVLNKERDLLVCGEAEDHLGALSLIEARRPDLALVDLILKDSNGLELIKDARIRYPGLRILVLSMHDEALYAERALRAGARGYISKQEATRNILTAIRTVLAGNIYLSQAQVNVVTSKMANYPRGATTLSIDTLTDRELLVFEMLGQGHGTRDIARRLRLDMRTIETYRARIKQKLDLRTANELLQQAIRWVESGVLPEKGRQI